MNYSMNDFDYWDDAGLSGFLSKAWKKAKKAVKKVTKVVTAPAKKVLQSVGVYDDLKEFESKHRDDLKKLGAAALIVATAGAAAPALSAAIGPALSSGLAAAKTYVATNLASAGAALKAGAIAQGKKALAAVSVDNIKKTIADKAKASAKQAVGRALTQAEELIIDQGTANDVDASGVREQVYFANKAAAIPNAPAVIDASSRNRADAIRIQIAELEGEMAPYLHLGLRSQMEELRDDRSNIDKAIANFDSGAGEKTYFVNKAAAIPNAPLVTNAASRAAADAVRKRVSELEGEMVPYLHLGLQPQMDSLRAKRASIDASIANFDASNHASQASQAKSNNGLLIGGGLLLASLLMGG